MVSPVITALTLVLLLISELATLTVGQASSYTPILVPCPATVLTRTGSPLDGNQQLDSSELSFISNRRSNVSPTLWQTYLADSITGSTGYNVSQLVAEVPRLATAVSGGGLRASLFGAGTLSAFDSRNASSAGPLLQLSDYLSGLSGGSWVVTSLAMSGFVDLYSLVLGLKEQPGWLLSMDILAPGGLLGVSDNNEYYDDLLEDVRGKAAAGFPVSIEDVWGRALSYHFFNGTNATNFYDNDDHSQGLLFSSLRLMPNFASMPLPIIVTTSRINSSVQTSNSSSTTVIPLSNTQFEFTPFTFGSFDPSLQARVPIEYAGTYLNNGVPANSSACANSYQNAGFVLGSSAGLFNAIENIVDPTIVDLVTLLTNDINSIQSLNYSVPLVANWPNSFYNFSPSSTTSFESANNQILQITDGGENGENIPIAPLLVKSRSVDVILAVDGSADTDFTWPNGTSLIATSIRIAGFPTNFSSFPPVPQTQDVYIAQGLNTRPTFFGCNTTGNGNTSVLGNYPLVIYLPNAPPPVSSASTYFTNTSTFKLDYSDADTTAFLNAAHVNALKGYQSGTEASDPDWPLCLKCALVERARKRANLTRTVACQTCLSRYCWSGDTIVDIMSGLLSPTSAAGGSGGTKTGAASQRLVDFVLGSGFFLLGAILVL